MNEKMRQFAAGLVGLFSTAVFLTYSPTSVRAQASDCLPPATPSVIDIPIQASLDKVFQEIEKTDQSGSEDRVYDHDECIDYWLWKDCYGVFVQYRWHRDPFSPSWIGNKLTLNLSIHYGVRAWLENPGPDISVSCGWNEPEKLATTKLETTIGWNSDYGLTSSTSAAGVATECKVTFKNIDVSGKVADKLNPKLDFAKNKVNQMISAFNFRPLAETAWADMQVPTRLGTSDQWLVVFPIAMGASPLNGSGNQVSTGAKLSAIVQVMRSKTKPNIGPAITLPPLGGGAQGSGLKLYAEGSVSFRDASAKVLKSFAGKQYQTALGPTTVRDAVASGNGHQVVLTIDTEGGLKASIRGEGRLVYDPAKKAMKAVDLVLRGTSPDTQTQQIIDALVNDASFVASVQEGAVWPLGTQLNELKTNLQAALNRPLGTKATISGQVDDPIPGDVFALPTSPLLGPQSETGGGYFRLFVTVSGTAKITVI